MAEAVKKKRRIPWKKILAVVCSIVLYLLYIAINQYINQQEFHVYMIDCGQGDSFLFEQAGKYAMIDCGTRTTGKDVADYLQKKGVNELQFIIATHQHDDHMGGMVDVLDTVKCNQIYMPKIDNSLVTTDWYIRLLSKINESKIPTKNLNINDVLYLGGASFTVLQQFNEEQAKDNLNNYSAVIKVSFGQNDLLMTGDAEKKVEDTLINMYGEEVLNCEILKVGHHGSDTSTSQKFLEMVNPEYTLISSGIGNRYKHPCGVTMEKLEQEGIKVFRTDEQSTVIITITPSNIRFDNDPADYIDGPTLAESKGVILNE